MDQNFPAYRGSPFIETPLIEVALYYVVYSNTLICGFVCPELIEELVRTKIKVWQDDGEYYLETF